MSDKKGVSLMVSYVLLIAITISLSITVFVWLKGIAGAEDAPECPAGINLIVQNYTCTAGSNGVISLTLKNKGRFNVSSFLVRVNDRSGAEFGIYTLNESRNNGPLAPGESKTSTYFLNESGSTGTVTLVDVQPRIEQDGEVIFCQSFSTQQTTCP